jgi:FAD synthase
MNIEISEVIDNGDGTVFVGAELDNEAYMAVVSVGLNAILRDALLECECDIEDDEAVYEDWIAEEVSETETKGE